MRLLLLTFTGFFIIGASNAMAESGFGTGFTEQSAKAFDNPADGEQEMAAEAQKQQAIEPAAGEEDKDEQDSGNTAENVQDTENIYMPGEVMTDKTVIEISE